MSPYRWAPVRVSGHSDDAEHAAILSLAASAARVRRLVLVPGILLGLVSAVAGYLAARELQLSFMHVHFPWISAVAAAPLFGAWLRVAGRFGNAVVRRSAPGWAEELAASYRVPASTLAEYIDVL